MQPVCLRGSHRPSSATEDTYCCSFLQQPRDTCCTAGNTAKDRWDELVWDVKYSSHLFGVSEREQWEYPRLQKGNWTHWALFCSSSRAAYTQPSVPPHLGDALAGHRTVRSFSSGACHCDAVGDPRLCNAPALSPVRSLKTHVFPEAI